MKMTLNFERFECVGLCRVWLAAQVLEQLRALVVVVAVEANRTGRAMTMIGKGAASFQASRPTAPPEPCWVPIALVVPLERSRSRTGGASLALRLLVVVGAAVWSEPPALVSPARSGHSPLAAGSPYDVPCRVASGVREALLVYGNGHCRLPRLTHGSAAVTAASEAQRNSSASRRTAPLSLQEEALRERYQRSAPSSYAHSHHTTLLPLHRTETIGASARSKKEGCGA